MEGRRFETQRTGQYYTAEAPLAEHEQQLTLIPYYAWCNRAEGQMQVWVRETR